MELSGFEPLSEELCQEYTTSLSRELDLALCPSTGGVVWRQPVGLRSLFPDAKATAPRFVSPGSYHPGLGRSDVATKQQRE